MTSKHDTDISKVAKEKTALFLIVPDEDSTNYPLVTLFLKQAYMNLVKTADLEYGGGLPIRINFNLEEFGNFPAVPDFDKALTVGWW
ncbi:hypothetical protein AZF37_07270 [endosymbiont 'TC1' of Trimyema compressum]|uniref:type IV secretory system conjugative DNA transfer family protein n=1 Tax=endosymbiont 'TC1' of Trimyema compressum TaxID=243899 RepID=UPI0007F0AEF2|nr:type IV secretory system conjugative DNA transfer family protein [endosymbiont 'TC1' of Trimyema compressum]AMP20987.1 hypothetical protein AZF37_07270 [endosymbiont 'TC1' of Trimyema compressum]